MDSSPFYGRYCAKNIPKIITSFSNQLYIRFYSDGNVENKGFNMEWDSTSSGCGGTLTTYEGSIVSPNYPQFYPNRIVCNWLISASQGSTLSILITDMAFDRTPSCNYDFIEIYDGDSVRSNSIGRYCNSINSPIAIQTHTNKAFIRFVADNIGSGRGFSLTYTTNCYRKIIEPYGSIESPNYPQNYPLSISCEWEIEAPKGNKIHLEFSHLELEERESVTNCIYDFVKISDIVNHHDINPRMFCNRIPPPIISTENQIVIRFQSDFSLAGKGFHLEYKIEGCVDIFTEEQGQILSPNYPRNYKNDIECEWRIIASIGKVIELTIFDMDIEQSHDCKNDGLLVRNEKKKKNDDNNSNTYF